MGLHVFLGFVWVAVIFAGFMGSEHAIPVAALLAVGFGVKKFLDTYWNIELQDGKFLSLDKPKPAHKTPISTSRNEYGRNPGRAAPDFNPASYLHSAAHLSRRWCRVSGESDRFDRTPF